jgi:hypothetical protein
MEDRRGLVRVADRVEQRISGSRAAAWLGDHYLLELLRV